MRSPKSGARQAFVDDPLLAAANLLFDEGLPLGPIRKPNVGSVGAVLVDRALGPCAGLRQPVLDLAEGAKPVERSGR